MPPKKKKPAVNPIVVGTVSTRSTRRESVVNIEIPKLKSGVKHSKISKEIDKESGAVIQTTNSKSTALNFSERIKESYNNMINRCLDSSLLVKKSELTKIKPSTETTTKSSFKTETKGNTAPSKTRGKVKSNEALLQILEDWTDDDSQDEKKDTSEVNSSDDADPKSYEVQENENKSSDDEKDIMLGIEQDINNGSLSTKRLLQTLEDNQNEDESADEYAERVRYYEKMESRVEICEVTDLDDLESADTGPLIEEYVVEENVRVIEAPVEETVPFEEGEIIVECVTEEIIEEENNSQQVVMEIAEEINTQTVSEDNEERVEIQNVISTEPNEDKVGFEDSQPSSEKENADTSSTVKENLILEETSQSVSTSDSNDAEVRGFFTREIENNEIVNHESFPDIEYEVVEEVTSATRDNADSVTSVLEENVVESEIAAEVENITISVEESPLDSESNSEGLKEQCKESIKKGSESKSEEVLVKKENDDFGEKMDTTEVVSEESIESKVAQLHLKDDDVKEEYLKDAEIKMEVEGLEEKISEESSKEKTEVVLKVEKPPLRRTRSREFKSPKIDKEVEVQKLAKSKERKTAKPKEPKSKEAKPSRDSKSKKKISPSSTAKKFKEKSDKKDTGKVDKKDTSKKSSKTDSDTFKKISASDFEDMEVRRSSRIKSISVLKKKTTGHGLVRSKSEPTLNESDISDSNSTQNESEKSTPSASPKVSGRERKTRWTRSSENLSTDSQSVMNVVMNKSDGSFSQVTSMEVDEKPKLPMSDPVVKARLKQFVHLKENSYKTDRMTCKEAKKMICDCFLTSEEIEKGELGCGDDCLNRLLLIECGNLCPVGDRCTNKRFQSGQFAPLEVFNTEKKGLGLRAAANIPYGEFILEYVGEVLNCDEFDKRAEVYSQDKNIHYYFMSLRADAIIDATAKGNISRFINHSCDPNAETQKWTVNGELRIGFFSTRTILAGEEVTFDYRFQRYGKEAQKCYCEAASCRGWLGEQPDEDSEDDDEEEEEEEEEEVPAAVKVETPEVPELQKPKDEEKPAEVAVAVKDEVKVEKETIPSELPATPVVVKRKSLRKKPRKDLFEDLDQLEEEIEMLVTTGLKNQAHTLKLSRLMVRAKEPAQRTKLLRILRRGELPCRRLFLDYHGLRLMHGYMIDAQHLVHADKKYESLRLEMLQTLAVLPIPNKTMLQDSKVLPTVEKWATNKDDLSSPLDSDSNSPKNEQDATQTPKSDTNKDKNKEPKRKTEEVKKEEGAIERSIEDQEEEIKFLASKLVEGWANLKEVFRIPKKERIEQMKEHEREANKKFMQSGYGAEQDSGRKSDRYRHLSRYKFDRDSNRKGSKSGEKPSAEFIRLSKIERRKLFALQHELKEEERRLKQREMWRQHEINCMLIGTDPRFTAPFDPSRGFQCIWNPQIGQWQNYPLPSQNQPLYSPQPPTPSSISLPTLPNLNLPPPMQIPKSIPNFPFPPQIGIPTSLNGGLAQIPTSMGITGQVPPLPPTSVAQMHIPPQIQTMPPTVQQITSMQGIPGALPQNIPTHQQVPSSIASTQLPIVNYQEPVKKEEDPSQVKFMGPIPPPVKLPPKWKCAKDKYGRPYYYHIKIRKSQWEPPPLQEPSEELEESSESESSSDTSSISSDTSSENSESDDDIDDTRLLMEVRKQMEKSAKLTLKTVIPDVKTEEEPQFSPSPEERNSDDNDMENDEDVTMTPSFMDEDFERPSIDIRLKEQFPDLLKDDKPPKKKRRTGLCEEIIISPRTEEDKLQFREDLKRYKANKEKLKRQKDLILQQTRKQLRECEPKKLKEKRTKSSLKSRIKEMSDFNSEAAKKIKETFRSNMASTVVGALNVYRKPDCKEGKITNTEDFKHLARKLTHFVMLKEMKHIAKIEDLTCTDNVKSKAREYIKKYMSKFGEVYIKRNDSPDFKD